VSKTRKAGALAERERKKRKRKDEKPRGFFPQFFFHSSFFLLLFCWKNLSIVILCLACGSFALEKKS